MTGNVTKFSKATAEINNSESRAGFKRGIAAMTVNIAEELVSRGVSFGAKKAGNGM